MKQETKRNRLTRKKRAGLAASLIAAIALVATGCDDSSDDNDLLPIISLLALASEQVPGPQDCAVKQEPQGGGDPVEVTRRLYTAAGNPQSIFTAEDVDVYPYSVWVEVRAAEGTVLEIQDFPQLGTGTRVVSSAYKGTGCPIDTVDGEEANAGTDYEQQDNTESVRTITFPAAGNFQIQLYTGTGTATPGAPQPLPAEFNPEIRIR